MDIRQRGDSQARQILRPVGDFQAVLAQLQTAWLQPECPGSKKAENDGRDKNDFRETARSFWRRRAALER